MKIHWRLSKLMEMPDSLGDFLILHIALKNVDKHTRQLFEIKFSEKQYPTLSDFTEFLKDHCKSLKAAGDSRASSKLGHPKTPLKVISSNNKPSSFNQLPLKRSLH